MMSLTHIAFSVAGTSLMMGTASPEVLGAAAVAALLPDVDSSRSWAGRVLRPASRWLEERFAHRSLTHSFLASGAVLVASYPVAWLGHEGVWGGLSLGYFLGWLADCFTKTGVAAFYPSGARLVVPANPRLRLTTGSRAEGAVLFLLVALAVALVNINRTGGIVRNFNQSLGLPSGAIETVNEEISRYLLVAQVKGRNAITEQRVDQAFEVIEPLTANDLLVRGEAGEVYRVGQSAECQIAASQIRIRRGRPIRIEAGRLVLEEEELYGAMSQLDRPRTYLSGTLAISDAEGLTLPTHPDRFDTISLQPGTDIAYARLTSASPAEVAQKLGDYYASGSLIVREFKF